MAKYMMTMKLNRIIALVAIAFLAVGCYEKHEMVAPRELYNDNSFEAMFPEAEHITIAELKHAFGTISNTGVNSGWNNTIYKLIGEDIFVGHDVYIKGKVTTDDDQGNIYKSLYIQDDTSGIELKLNNNVGLRYKKGSWVYVRLTGLYLGNYRMMLSLGGAPRSRIIRLVSISIMLTLILNCRRLLTSTYSLARWPRMDCA